MTKIDEDHLGEMVYRGSADKPAVTEHTRLSAIGMAAFEYVHLHTTDGTCLRNTTGELCS